MLSEPVLKASILICCSGVILAMVVRYLKDPEGLFLDSSTYVLLLSLAYIAVPTYVHLDTHETVLKASFETILYSARYSVYFIAVISMVYIGKLLLCVAGFNGCIYNRGRRTDATETASCGHVPLVPIRETVIYTLYALIFVYIVAIYLVHFPSVTVLWSNRVAASAFGTPIYLRYKITFVFYMAASLSIYLCLRRCSSRYLLLLLPFVLLNLVTSDRDYLYSATLLAIGVRTILKERVPVSVVVGVMVILAAIGTVRATWRHGVQLDRVLTVPGEFLISAEAGYVILQSRESVDVPALVAYSLGTVFTPMAANALLGGNPNFSWILREEAGRLWFGLGGSLLCEVYSTKNRAIEIVYPFLLMGYTIIINKLLAHRSFFAVLVFLFFLAGTHSLFRTGIVYSSCRSLYYGIYAAGWYWLSYMLYKQKGLLYKSRAGHIARYV
jgi:hypothetical protein